MVVVVVVVVRVVVVDVVFVDVVPVAVEVVLSLASNPYAIWASGCKKEINMNSYTNWEFDLPCTY